MYNPLRLELELMFACLTHYLQTTSDNSGWFCSAHVTVSHIQHTLDCINFLFFFFIFQKINEVMLPALLLLPVSRQVYPVWIYSSLVLLIPVPAGDRFPQIQPSNHPPGPHLCHNISAPAEGLAQGSSWISCPSLFQLPNCHGTGHDPFLLLL